MPRLLLCVVTTLRFLLAVAAALALLFTFSYPDSILPPNPLVADIPGFTVYTIKPVLWLIPLMALELICLAGPHRNRMWFASTLTVLICGLLAWPVLQAWRPELVFPMLPFEDGKLSAGLGYMAILLAVSIIFRLVLLAHIFQRPMDWQSGGEMEASVLDPANARTVREIAADTTRVQPHFLFGDADQGLIEQFRQFMGRVWKRTLLRRALLGLAILAGLVWFFCYPRLNEAEALARDLSAMYETDASGARATPRAVHSAWRVMKHIHDHESLAGMSFIEAEDWLQLMQAPLAYRLKLRDEKVPEPASVDPTFESRTPFLTVTDGRRTAALYVRTDASGEHINVAEVVDAGWNAVQDSYRRRFGNDWNVNY